MKKISRSRSLSNTPYLVHQQILLAHNPHIFKINPLFIISTVVAPPGLSVPTPCPGLHPSVLSPQQSPKAPPPSCPDPSLSSLSLPHAPAHSLGFSCPGLGAPSPGRSRTAPQLRAFAANPPLCLERCPSYPHLTSFKSPRCHLLGNAFLDYPVYIYHGQASVLCPPHLLCFSPMYGPVHHVCTHSVPPGLHTKAGFLSLFVVHCCIFNVWNTDY